VAEGPSPGWQTEDELLADLHSWSPLPDEADPRWHALTPDGDALTPEGDALWTAAQRLLDAADAAGERGWLRVAVRVFEHAADWDLHDMMQGIRHGPERAFLAVPDGTPRFAHELEALSHHPRSGTRLWTVRELGILRQRSSLGFLLERIDDPHPAVAQEALTSLEMLAQVHTAVAEMLARLDTNGNAAPIAAPHWSVSRQGSPVNGVRQFVAALRDVRARLFTDLAPIIDVAGLLAAVRAERRLPRQAVTRSGIEYSVHGTGCRMTSPEGTVVDVDLVRDPVLGRDMATFDTWRIRWFLDEAAADGYQTEDILAACAELTAVGELRAVVPGRWYCEIVLDEDALVATRRATEGEPCVADS
jgi:hypothetical protein